MTQDEVLAVAEIVERAAKRYNEQAAAHERTMQDHRMAFNARTEADRQIIEGLRAEVERLKSLSPKYKVGDKLESYNRSLGLAIPVTVQGVRLVYDCIADGAEYPVGYSEAELRAVASHDTTAGKEAAEAVVRDSQMTEIKVGDVVEVFQKTGLCTRPTDMGKGGIVSRFIQPNCVDLGRHQGMELPSGAHVSLCDVRKVRQ